MTGLTEEQDTVSLASDDEDHYLRHYNKLVDLEHKTNHRNPEVFKADATFR